MGNGVESETLLFISAQAWDEWHCWSQACSAACIWLGHACPCLSCYLRDIDWIVSPLFMISLRFVTIKEAEFAVSHYHLGCMAICSTGFVMR